MTRTIASTQLALYFYVGPAASAADHEASYEATGAIHYKAADLIYAGVVKLPEWHVRLGNNGFPAASDSEGSEYPRAEFCEPDGELTEVNGRLAHSVFFHASGEFPIDLAKALKDFCLAQYKLAAGELSVEFSQAKRYIKWDESEENVWAELQ